MAIDLKAIYSSTYKHYTNAKKNIETEFIFENQFSAISNVIPGFDADKLEFGSYDKENFAVLFVDMKGSTKRAQNIGAEKTFLTMHVFLTALLEVVKHYHGKVIDIMGDGIMVFWGGKHARELDNMNKRKAVQKAGLCGRDMLTVLKKIINKIIEDEKLGNEISIGIGVTFGSVIVTKIGINDTYDVKAFGECVNMAFKYASESKYINKVKVSKKVKELWPKGKGGKIKFEQSKDDSFILMYGGVNG